MIVLVIWALTPVLTVSPGATAYLIEAKSSVICPPPATVMSCQSPGCGVGAVEVKAARWVADAPIP